MKYRKKPVVIEAVKFEVSSPSKALKFLGDSYSELTDEGLLIATLEGNIFASDGDYIIKGVQGEFYPCKPDIFAQTYEKVSDELLF